MGGFTIYRYMYDDVHVACMYAVHMIMAGHRTISSQLSQLSFQCRK